MIHVISNKADFLVSVIIPLQKKREYFFNQFVLPMVEANGVSEIIINPEEGGAAKKRNDAFKKSTQPYIMFLDDDIILPLDYIDTLYSELKSDLEASYTYTGYTGIVFNDKVNGRGTNFEVDTVDFDEVKLKSYNYISTMSLMRREAFLGFDESLKRFIDYDLYLRMLSKGMTGKAVHGLKFYAFYLDDGITNVHNEGITQKDIQKRY